MKKVFVAILMLVFAAAFTYPKAGTSCVIDADCYEKYEHCVEIQGSLECKHRNLFPLRGLEIGGVILFTFLVATANFGGIAGGFGLIAFYMMFMFSVPTGIVLSNAQIVISCVIRIITGIGKPHPHRGCHGTLYHFAIVSMMIPMCSLGSTLATLISRVIPDLFIVIAYFVILLGVFLFNLGRLVTIVKKEKGVAVVKPA